MCGRYVTEEEHAEMEKLLRLLRLHTTEPPVKCGEIFPADTAAIVLRSARNTPDVVAAKWGFPLGETKKLLINGRAETVLEKPVFSACFTFGRCVVPANGFYEWSHDADKQKYLFGDDGKHLLYLAGLWRPGEGGREFVILTTSANDSMRDVHSRMPVILPRASVREWLLDDEKAVRHLYAPGPTLRKTPA